MRKNNKTTHKLPASLRTTLSLASAQVRKLARFVAAPFPTKSTTSREPLKGGVKKGFRAYAAVVLAAALMLCFSVPAFAASDPITVVNNLSDFIFGLIRAIGLILLGFGIVQVGLSLKSHDPSQRANGFLTLAGGIIITFAKEILNLITG
jgi:hypothetical protein